MAYVSVGQVENLEETVAGLNSNYDSMESACQNQISADKAKLAEAQGEADNSSQLLDAVMEVDENAWQRLKQTTDRLASANEQLNSACSSLSAWEESGTYDEDGKAEKSLEAAKRHRMQMKQVNEMVRHFSIRLFNRLSSNLLICVYNNAIHDGLLFSILQSLKAQNGIDEIIYFNGRSIVTLGGSEYLDVFVKRSVSRHESASTLNLSGISDELKKSKRILLIDGLNSTKEFYSGLASFPLVKKDDSPSPQESLKKILEDVPEQGIFVIAFADNWKRCNSSRKDLLSFFEIPASFYMNKRNAGSFVSNVIGKYKGLGIVNHTFFVDRLKNKIIWFRLFGSGEKV